jgi:hypothetical protein
MTGSSNAYCARLGVTRIPRVEEFVGRRGPFGPTKLFDLMIVALLENGEPMTFDSVVARLDKAGARSPVGDLPLSLKKSWRRRNPIYQDESGRLALDLVHPDLSGRLFSLGLRPPYVEPLPDPPPIAMPGDDVPLSLADVEAAFRGRPLYSISPARIAAAVLEARGESMTAEAIDEELRLLGAGAPLLLNHAWQQVNSTVVRVSGQTLTLDQESPQLPGMRRAVRRRAEQELRRRAGEERFRKQKALAGARIAEIRAREEREAQSLRRVMLRLVPDAGEPAGLACADLQTLNIRTFLFDEIKRACLEIDSYDVVAGIEVRECLRRLGLSIARFQTIELGPPKKTVKLNRRGDRLRLTPELVISGSTGIRRPLTEAATLAADIAARSLGRLRRALERDAKSLVTFYDYVRLHRYARLRWGFLDERLHVDWPVPGDESLHGILENAARNGSTVELVLGRAPSWKAPWADARRGTISRFEWGSFRFQEGVLSQVCDGADVQAARVL